VQRSLPYLQVSVCPQFPRTALSSSHEARDFLLQTTYAGAALIPANSVKRVPDGAGSLTYSAPPRVPAQYVELNKYGLLYAARHFARFRRAADLPEELDFAGLFDILLRLTTAADRFYAARGYRGNLAIRTSLHGVQSQIMRFLTPGPFEDLDLEDFRCFIDTVTAERLLGADQLRSQRVDVLTDILSEITWAFWQSNRDHPAALLRASVERGG